MSAATVQNDQTEDLTTWNLSDYSLYREMSSIAFSFLFSILSLASIFFSLSQERIADFVFSYLKVTSVDYQECLCEGTSCDDLLSPGNSSAIG